MAHSAAALPLRVIKSFIQLLKRTAHSLFYLLMGVLVASVLLSAAVAWRLSQGPVSLSWAVPAVDYVLDRAIPQLQVSLGDVIVSWAGRDQGLDLRFLNVDVSTRDDRRLARLPELSVALSAEALRQFRLAPTEINIYGPRVRLVRREDGAFEFALAETEGSATPFGAFIQEALRKPRDPADPFSYLDVVTITNGRFVYRDLQLDAVWRGRLAKGQIVRAGRSMSLEANLGLTAGNEPAYVRINALAAAATGSMAVQVQVQNLRPAPFAAVASALAPLQSIDLPLAGTASIATGWSGRIRRLDFDVSGGSGRIELTAPLAARLGLEETAAQTLEVRELTLAGNYDAASGMIAIEPSGILFADRTALHVPAPVDQTFPLASLSGKGRFDLEHDAVTDASIDLDLAGPKLRVEGEARAVSGDISGQAKILIDRVKVDDLAVFWPKVIAPGGRTWALAHLSSGALEQGEILLGFGPTAKGTDVTSLSGRARADGLQVDYLPPAPPLRNAAGSANFDLDRLTVAIAGGEADGLTLSGGTATISGFKDAAPTLQLDADIQGTVPATLQFLAREPFGFTKNIGIDAAATRGTADATLGLTLPLVKDPQIKDISLRATADVADLFIPNALLGGNVTGGNLRLDIDEKGMDVFGPAAFENIGVRVAWHENFNGAEPYVRQIDLAVPSMRIENLRRIEPELVATLRPWVDGPLSGQATVTFKTNEDIVFDADVDASRAALAFPPLGWSKAPGKRTFVFAQGRFADGRLAEVGRASISAPALEAAGSLALTAKGSVERIIVDRLISGNTDASAVLTAMPGQGWDVVIGGNRLDVHPLLEERNKTAASEGDAATETFTLSADLDRLWLQAEEPIRAVSATIIRNKGVFELVQVAGLVGDNAPILVDIGPAGPRTRTLRVRADNAGSALRALDILPDIQGGDLRMDGTFNDTDPRTLALDGTLKIKRFHLTGAPILAQILNVMALTGIIDLLRGEGIAFSTLDVPFTLRGNVLSLIEAKMHGNAIGVTAAGTYDIARDAIDVRGTLIPIYVLNSLLGRLPLIGGLFSGGERGGGLFAVRYSVGGTMAEPQIAVNPVSALTPGILRNIFSLFNRVPNQETFAPLPAPSHSP